MVFFLIYFLLFFFFDFFFLSSSSSPLPLPLPLPLPHPRLRFRPLPLPLPLPLLLRTKSTELITFVLQKADSRAPGDRSQALSTELRKSVFVLQLYYKKSTLEPRSSRRPSTYLANTKAFQRPASWCLAPNHPGPGPDQ